MVETCIPTSETQQHYLQSDKLYVCMCDFVAHKMVIERAQHIHIQKILAKRLTN